MRGLGERTLTHAPQSTHRPAFAGRGPVGPRWGSVFRSWHRILRKTGTNGVGLRQGWKTWKPGESLKETGMVSELDRI